VGGFKSLTLTRNLGRLFDGIRFASANQADMRKRALRNFVNHNMVRLGP